ncbi:MAG: hypothetical protein AAF456_10400 [Planctomycetota bacterium]
MRKRRSENRRFGFENLEDRRLLAADCGAQFMAEVETFEPPHCEMASAEYPADEIVATDLITEEAPTFDSAVVGEASLIAESSGEAIDSADPAPVEPGTTEPGNPAPATLDPRVLNLEDGMDGYFGTLNPENPAETIEFTASADGMIDIVVASSFDEGHTVLSVSDSAGEVIETAGQGLEGFDVLSFEVSEGESYQLLFASTEADCEGHFQMTAGFEPFVDQHADLIGAESTELQFTDGATELSGRLEHAGDIDTFRFTAEGSGEMTLELNETVDDARINLNVSIQDADGNVFAGGSTNQMLQLTFDAETGNEYFVSIEAGDGQKGTYGFSMNLDAVAEPAVEVSDEMTSVGTESSDQPASETAIDAEIADDDVSDLVSDSTQSDPAETEPSDAMVEEADIETVAEVAIDQTEPVEVAINESEEDCDKDTTDEVAEDTSGLLEESAEEGVAEEAVSDGEASSDMQLADSAAESIQDVEPSVDEPLIVGAEESDSDGETAMVDASGEECDKPEDAVDVAQPQDAVVEVQPEEQVAIAVEDIAVEDEVPVETGAPAIEPADSELADAWVDAAGETGTLAEAETEASDDASNVPLAEELTAAPETTAPVEMAEENPDTQPGDDCVFGQEAIDEFFAAISEDHDFEFSFTRGPHTLGFIPYFSNSSLNG